MRGKKYFGLLIITLLGTAICGVGLAFNLGAKFENRMWDKRLEVIAERSQPNPKIKIIVVDQSALNSLAESSITWPWPRVMWQPVLEFLNFAGAKAAAFDLIFTEESRSGVVDDQDFAAAIKSSRLPIVSAVVPTAGSETGSSAERVQLLREQIEKDEAQSHFKESFLWHPLTPQKASVLTPIPEVLQASAGFGSVWGEPDADALFRHHRPGVLADGMPLLSLPFALYHSLHPEDDGQWLRKFFDNSGQLTLHFNGGARSYEMIGYTAILDACKLLALPSCKDTPLEADPETRARIERDTKQLLQGFQHALVLIGVDAPALLDYRPTPLAEKAPGVEVNATVLDNILERQFIKKIEGAHPLTLLSTAVLTAATAYVVLFISSGWIAAAYVLLVLAGATYGAYLLAFDGFWVPMLWPQLSIIGGAVGALGLQYVIEGRQHRFVRNAFRHYVSEAVLDKIIDDPAGLSLGGEKRELTIFFSDIQGFTSLSESIEPTTLVELLNVYLTAMTRIIMQHGGTVDKYVGDAIVAFWNAPLPEPQHALLGIKATLECQKVLAEMAPALEKTYGVAIKARVGLNTGVVTVGNFGSDERFNYTVIGDAANLASRLEGSNKYFGTYTLITQATRDAVGSALCARKIGSIKVVGRSEAVTVYEPLSLDGGAVKTEDEKKFEIALKLFEARQLKDALEIFNQLPNDPVANVYSKRIKSDLEQIEGGAAWSPIWNLTEK